MKSSQMSKACFCLHHMSRHLNRLLTALILHLQEGKHGEGFLEYVFSDSHVSVVISTHRSLMCASKEFILSFGDLMGNQIEITSVNNKY